MTKVLPLLVVIGSVVAYAMSLFQGPNYSIQIQTSPDSEVLFTGDILKLEMVVLEDGVKSGLVPTESEWKILEGNESELGLILDGKNKATLSLQGTKDVEFSIRVTAKIAEQELTQTKTIKLLSPISRS